jgi:hypothetical protein
VVFRKQFHTTLEALQRDLDAFIGEQNTQRPHQGRWCYGKTPMQTFRDSVALAKERVSGILCVGHSMRSIDAPDAQTEAHGR